MHISQSILMPLFFTCLSLEIFFPFRLYSVAPIFQGGWTTTGQSAFLLVREGVTSFMRANFTSYITKIQEIPGLRSLGPHQHWTHWGPKSGPRPPLSEKIHPQPEFLNPYLVITVIHMKYIRSIRWQYLFNFFWGGGGTVTFLKKTYM